MRKPFCNSIKDDEGEGEAEEVDEADEAETD